MLFSVFVRRSRCYARQVVNRCPTGAALEVSIATARMPGDSRKSLKITKIVIFILIVVMDISQINVDINDTRGNRR